MVAVCSWTRVVIEFNVHRPAHRNSFRDYHLFVNHLHKENRIQWINLTQTSLLCKEQKGVMPYWENLYCSLRYSSVSVPRCKDSCNTNQRRDQHSGGSIGEKKPWRTVLDGGAASRERRHERSSSSVKRWFRGCFWSINAIYFQQKTKLMKWV